MSRRSRQHNPFFLFLLFRELFQNGNIPLATLLILGVNIGGHLFFDIPLDEVCLMPVMVVEWRHWAPVLVSSFIHADDTHLYYNMISFAWKGRQLEPRMGIVRFLWAIFILAISSNVLYIGIAYILAHEFDYPGPYYHQCAVGFSAVLFGLKVILTHDSGSQSAVFGGLIRVPARYAAWAELVLISLVVPNASFL
eukprot:883384_1